jgi:hypothetical protein
MIKHIAWPYVISKFELHETIKEKLLFFIEEDFVGKSVDDNNDKIVKTDWYTDRKLMKPYLHYLYPYLTKHMSEVYDAVGHDIPKYTDFWYQQYDSKDKHKWHQHRGCCWANVYYVELQNTTQRTMLKDPFSKEIIIPEVEEGDIITFPGLIWHCSPENLNEERKTVVAFNVY